MVRNVDADAADRLRRALRAVLERDLDAAEHELAEMVRIDSRDTPAYMALALLYRERGEVGRALQVHQNLLLRGDLHKEERVRVQLALGEDLHAGGYRDRAVAAYGDVFEADPRCAAACDALVELHVEAGESELALAVLKRNAGWLRRVDPVREAGLLEQLAREQHQRGRNDEARRTARRAIKRNPEAPAPRLLLGELEAERGRPKAALAAWSGAVELVDDSADWLWERVAAMHAGLGKNDDFESFARAHVARVPGHPAAHRALARCLAARGDADGAQLELRGLLDADPSDARTRAELGRLLLAEERSTDALKAYEEWIEVIAPRDPFDPMRGGGGSR